MCSCRWGGQPHGSAWVYRQAKQFLCEEFAQLINSPVLAQIDKEHLVDCLHSDFLQASELEVLQAMLNWAESKLIKNMEDRGSFMSPNERYLWIVGSYINFDFNFFLQNLSL